LTRAATLDEETVLLDRDSLALYQALTHLVRVYQFRDREQICFRGISVTQCYALTALVWHGPMTLNELAKHLYLDKSTVSRVVDTMELKGIARRRPHRDSRRAIELSPTAKGRQLHSTIQKDMIKRERELITEFDAEIRKAVIDVIRRLAVQAEERMRASAAGT
jgi:DNA-binding MarR family transcriptional regulator